MAYVDEETAWEVYDFWTEAAAGPGSGVCLTADCEGLEGVSCW